MNQSNHKRDQESSGGLLLRHIFTLPLPRSPTASTSQLCRLFVSSYLSGHTRSWRKHEWEGHLDMLRALSTAGCLQALAIWCRVCHLTQNSSQAYSTLLASPVISWGHTKAEKPITLSTISTCALQSACFYDSQELIRGANHPNRPPIDSPHRYHDLPIHSPRVSHAVNFRILSSCYCCDTRGRRVRVYQVQSTCKRLSTSSTSAVRYCTGRPRECDRPLCH